MYIVNSTGYTKNDFIYFRNKVKFSNIKLCVSCKGNFHAEGNACDIKMDEIPEYIKNQPDFDERIRFQKYSVCNSCKENNYQPSPIPSIDEDLLEFGKYKNIDIG